MVSLMTAASLLTDEIKMHLKALQRRGLQTGDCGLMAQWKTVLISLINLWDYYHDKGLLLFERGKKKKPQLWFTSKTATPQVGLRNTRFLMPDFEWKNLIPYLEVWVSNLDKGSSG